MCLFQSIYSRKLKRKSIIFAGITKGFPITKFFKSAFSHGLSELASLISTLADESFFIISYLFMRISIGKLSSFNKTEASIALFLLSIFNWIILPYSPITQLMPTLVVADLLIM